MFIGTLGNLPSAIPESLRTAVELILPFVRCQAKSPLAQRKFGASNAVGVTPARGAEKRLLGEIVVEPSATEQHFPPRARDRNNAGKPGRAPIHQGQTDPRCAIDRDQNGRIAVRASNRSIHSKTLPGRIVLQLSNKCRAARQKPLGNDAERG